MMIWSWKFWKKKKISKKTVYPSPVLGILNAPASKSMTQRAIAAGLQTPGITSIYNPAFCNDTNSALEAARKLGAEVVEYEDHIKVAGGLSSYSRRINCGESGLVMRMFAPLAAMKTHKITFMGEGSLRNRPVQMIEEALSQLGVEVRTNNGLLPFSLEGPIRGGKLLIDGSVSSQLLTGLLMTLPLMEEDSEIQVRNLKSRPYISMTIDLLREFGIRIENRDFETFLIKGGQEFHPVEYLVEGDWSNCAFLLVAGAIAGEIHLEGLNLKSLQADRAILEALRKAGAEPGMDHGYVSVLKSELRAFDFNATDCPDLFPPLAALAAYCKGTSRITGLSRLVHKESNRALSIQKVLTKLGIQLSLQDDVMQITGGEIRAATINPQNDHRIAMMAAVMALGSKRPVRILHADCVDKSYSDFYFHLEKLGVRIEPSYTEMPEPELQF